MGVIREEIGRIPQERVEHALFRLHDAHGLTLRQADEFLVQQTLAAARQMRPEAIEVILHRRVDTREIVIEAVSEKLLLDV